jgi:hypothetical protein
MSKPIESSLDIFEFIDKFEELKVFANFAERLINTIGGDDGFQCPFNWAAYRDNPKWGPEDFAKKELTPYLVTLKTRLPEFYELVKKTLYECDAGKCPFHDDEAKESEAGGQDSGAGN